MNLSTPIESTAVLALTHIVHQTEKNFFDGTASEALEIERPERFARTVGRCAREEV